VSLLYAIGLQCGFDERLSKTRPTIKEEIANIKKCIKDYSMYKLIFNGTKIKLGEFHSESKWNKYQHEPLIVLYKHNKKMENPLI